MTQSTTRRTAQLRRMTTITTRVRVKMRRHSLLLVVGVIPSLEERRNGSAEFVCAATAKRRTS